MNLRRVSYVRWGVNGWAVMKKKNAKRDKDQKKIQRHEGNQSPPDCYGLLVMKFRSFFFCGTRWDEAIRTVMRVAKLNGNLRGPWTPGISAINLIPLELQTSSQNSPFQTGQTLVLKRKQFYPQAVSWAWLVTWASDLIPGFFSIWSPNISGT